MLQWTLHTDWHLTSSCHYFSIFKNLNRFPFQREPLHHVAPSAQVPVSSVRASAVCIDVFLWRRGRSVEQRRPYPVHWSLRAGSSLWAGSLLWPAFCEPLCAWTHRTQLSESISCTEGTHTHTGFLWASFRGYVGICSSDLERNVHKGEFITFWSHQNYANTGRSFRKVVRNRVVFDSKLILLNKKDKV